MQKKEVRTHKVWTETVLKTAGQSQLAPKKALKAYTAQIQWRPLGLKHALALAGSGIICEMGDKEAWKMG